MAHYKISDIAEEVKDRENNPAESVYDRFVGLEHYVSGDLEIIHFGSSKKLESAMKVFRAGDTLVARRNVYLKRASIVQFDGLTSGDSIVLRAKQPVMARILPFVLNTDDFWDYAEKYSDGTMSKRLSPKILMEYEFNISNDRLEDISEILWAANKTRNGYKKLLHIMDELVKSRFIELFGDPVHNSMKWNTELLCHLGDLNRGVSKHRPRNDPKLLGGIYPLIQTGDVANSDGYIRSYKSTYSEEGLKQSKMWSSGVLCITIAANIAKTAILSFDACFRIALLDLRLEAK